MKRFFLSIAVLTLTSSAALAANRVRLFEGEADVLPNPGTDQLELHEGAVPASPPQGVILYEGSTKYGCGKGAKCGQPVCGHTRFWKSLRGMKGKVCCEAGKLHAKVYNHCQKTKAYAAIGCEKVKCGAKAHLAGVKSCVGHSCMQVKHKLHGWWHDLKQTRLPHFGCTKPCSHKGGCAKGGCGAAVCGKAACGPAPCKSAPCGKKGCGKAPKCGHRHFLHGLFGHNKACGVKKGCPCGPAKGGKVYYGSPVGPAGEEVWSETAEPEIAPPAPAIEARPTPPVRRADSQGRPRLFAPVRLGPAI